MKRIVYVYCGEDGEAGKAFAKSVRDGSSVVTLCSAAGFTTPESGNPEIFVTPDVPAWRRKQIEAAYGVSSEITAPAPSVPAVTVKHRGFGKWFLMRGDEVVSGPHSKDEAQRLAA